MIPIATAEAINAGSERWGSECISNEGIVPPPEVASTSCSFSLDEARTLVPLQAPELSANHKQAYTGLLLAKKSRLRGSILRVAKVAQADANQAKPLVRAEADTF